MEEQPRRQVILQRVVERLDVRINRLVAVRNRIQDLAESYDPRSSKTDDHETDPT